MSAAAITLTATGPEVGTYYKLGEFHFPAHSYNPRRYADSRRKWARDRRYRLGQFPANAFVTTTMMPGEGAISETETVERDCSGWKLLLQSCTRWIRSVQSKHGRCTECYLAVRACPGKHRGRRWRLQGVCSTCSKYRPLYWFASRHLWVCARCQEEGRGKIQTKDRKTPLVTAWMREPTRAGNLHRHVEANMPIIPQELLSRWAEAAHLGSVLDIRKIDAKTKRSSLDNYLLKQSQLHAPRLDQYLTKSAADEDAFNALPMGTPRGRINFPTEAPPRDPDVHFTTWPDELVAHLLFTPTPSPVALPERLFWLLAPHYLPQRAIPPPPAAAVAQQLSLPNCA
jgi:hypothetical protein